MAFIRKKDKVIVLAGKNKGRQGDVVQVLPEKERVLVAGVNFVKRHSKGSPSQPGGIREKEASIHISNVMLVCTKCQKPTRVKYDVLSDGTKVRACRQCGEMMVS